MIMAREVAPLNCAKPDKIWKPATLRKPATITWIYSLRGIFMLWPVTVAARNRTAAPMPEPATRKLHGDISRNANAAAIQFRPHANASSNTSSLAVAAVSVLAFGFNIAFGNPGGIGLPRTL